MKTKQNYTKGLCMSQSLYRPEIKSIMLSILILMGIYTSVQAQVTEYSRPSWWFGISGAANLNLYSGSTHQLNADFKPPVAFHEGKGLGLFLAPMIEYHRPNTRLGMQLQAGYDSRRGAFDEVITPCNCPADLSTDLGYLTIEPNIRFAPFKSGFYIFGGPRFAFNLSKSFTYELGINPAFPEQEKTPDVTGDFGQINDNLISMQVGMGYDIQLSTQSNKTQLAISPFVSFHPYIGQEPRSIETWDLTTVRAGVAVKFGRGKKVVMPKEILMEDPAFSFSVYAPENIPVERRVRETFPLRNYIFFDIGSTDIPDRYVILRKDQVKDFKEDQLEVFTPKKLSGRSDREMTVYYNVLNILGDRMQKNPESTITMVGSSEAGAQDGILMAESTKKYLVTIFGVNESRIALEGRNKPKVLSLQPGGTRELILLREGERRVSIESDYPALLMEFQSGPDAPLKPVELVTVQEAPVDSYVSFDVDGAEKAFESWSLEIKDENGIIQYFGPFTQEHVAIPGKSILGTRPKGDYKVTMIGKTENGTLLRKEQAVHMVLWMPDQNEEGMRYSVIFEFDESKSNSIYEKYLTEIVTPKIPLNGKVIIHGYTDVIGDAPHNRTLSLARANNVKKIIESSLTKLGRKDVKFEVHGFGEDENLSPFGNTFPEERSYNRTVIIDIIPSK